VSDWQKRLGAVGSTSTCRITTRGRRTGRPHTVTIWFAPAGPDRIVLGTLRLGRDWPKNLAANPDIEVQIGDLKLKGRATRVTEGPERSRIEAALAAKYLAARIGGWLGFKPQGVFDVRVDGEA
jgi:deazaflavin-dependent oxidoreductase (nitroreductase family)